MNYLIASMSVVAIHAPSSLMGYELEYFENNKSHVVVLLFREIDEFEKLLLRLKK